jgi:hypothetical protein
VQALLLDCKDNGDGTYFCVKFDPVRDAAEGSSGAAETVQADNPYIEEAKKECTYKKPRRVGGSVGSRTALSREKEKAAQLEYERCLARKAHQLKKARDQ